ncbi:YtxH domain-containing protein [Brumimicrobium aurantiacum]|uniref:YtxH domain-containing protein n=1 Tax=Brumimicrobium aurantiacum TaxID=1737063 RepID=A0A3E1EWA1_9FLAO|nr:YtxH domain-containing protein [Brumimicrobium aurantiacum]RFC53836.1 YtxH domain-containing protein [Brumimicrobium aurantiacum]
MDDKSKIIVSALAGAAVGAGIALLLAPASGKETREALASKINEAKDATVDALGNAKDAVLDKSDELLKQANIKS